MREKPHKRLLCILLCNSQILDAIRADYQSWQSQSSNTDSTQSEVRTCLPAKYHGLVSEFLECNKDYIHSLHSEVAVKHSI